MGTTALPEAIAAWAASNPKIKRVWLADREDEVDLTLEPQPVADSEESFAVWMGNCELWRCALQARIGGTFELRWFDPDAAGPMTGNVLVYESAP
ncbi:MAG TPA: hypothetical protein VE935_22370 [Burkholderiales bacterium]|nr:hypothetical protein [Burkholderiales bacterium]